MTNDQDPWDEASERWTAISKSVRSRYRQVVGDSGPDEDRVKEALDTIGDAARAVADSIGTALKDPETRDQLKKMTSSVASAIGATLSQLGEEILNPRSSGDDEAEPVDEGPVDEGPADEGPVDEGPVDDGPEDE